MITLKKINNAKITPIKVPHYDINEVKGGKIFSKLNCKILLLAKTESGKTNVVFYILKKCAGKNTNIIVFCSTVHNDDNWPIIIKHFKKIGINIHVCTSIDNEEGENQVENLLNNLAGDEEDIDEDKSQVEDFKSKVIAINTDKESEEEEVIEKKKAPEYILVFDDMAGELTGKTMSRLLKNSRHYKMKVIISTQYYNDLSKDCRQQLDYILLFPKISEDKLEKIHEDLDLHLPFDLFEELYENATNKKYNFLYIDTRSEEFRRNFNARYNFIL